MRRLVTVAMLLLFAACSREEKSGGVVQQILRDSPETVLKNEAKKRQEDEAKTAARAYIPKLELSGITVKDGVMGPYISGELKNNGDKTLNKVEITVYLLDASGKPIAEDTFHPVLVTKYSYDAKPLKPGYIEEVFHSIQSAPKDWAKKVRLEITSVEFAGAEEK